MLQNRTYLGKIKYQKYKRKKDGSRSFEAPIEWFDGQHEGVISQELFDKCMEVRAGRRAHRQATKRYNAYLLRDIAYCHRCCSNLPESKTFRYYGKMRGQSQWGGGHLYYRCRASDLGYHCEQKGVQVEMLDQQVVNILMSLKPPKNWRKGITQAMGELLGDKNLEQRLDEIRAIIKRMDTRWDHGFFTDEQEYLEQRVKLQLELEQLTPVPNDELESAAELLENFKMHWERLAGDHEAQHELVKLIVERVYVRDDEVVAMTLRSNCHLVLNHKANGPTYHEVDPLYAHGSDGSRSLTCIKSLVVFLPKHIVKQYLVTADSFPSNQRLGDSYHLSI